MPGLGPFLVQTLLISLSGVMAPGPVTAVAMGKGGRSPHAGALIALGHGVVEFPLMIALFFGFSVVIKAAPVRMAIALVGGAFLLWMARGLFLDARRPVQMLRQDPRGPFAVGIFLSAGNRYFLFWWATVGVALILQSASFGAFGFFLFAIVHWFCDLVWLWILSAVSFRGGRLLGPRFQKGVLLVSAVVFFVFGAMFIGNAILGMFTGRGF
ncbi:MAG TPA: LysE family transporter [Candidatus Sumerlaeota bacterium]|nr:LysE family transporter [Candidatus Sumerlaeota bacterium]